MILSFKGQLAEDLFFERRTTETRRFPPKLANVARRKLQYLNTAARLPDLRVPPGNRLEALSGDLKGFYSIRINDQWRLIFRWDDGPAVVAVVDLHQ